jgi:hypothetical protein
MATYSIRTQTDLEEMGAKGLTVANTFVLQNDITVANWTRIGKTWSGATLDFNGYGISGITTRGPKFIASDQSKNGITFTSTNYGQTHTISWLQGPMTKASTGQNRFSPIGNYVAGDGIFWSGDEGQIWYFCQGGWGVRWNLAYVTSQTLITFTRVGTTVNLYVGEQNMGSRTLGAFGKVLTISQLYTHFQGTWSSSMSEILITSDTKTQAWVTAQNNGGLGRYTTTANTPNLVVLWHCDEGSGTTVADSIGSNNLAGVDAWATPVVKGGFIETGYGTFNKPLIINPSVTWDLVDTTTSNESLQLGCLMNTWTETGFSTVNAGEIRGGTLSAAGVKYLCAGPFGGNGAKCTFNDCISSVDDFIWTPVAGVDYYPKVGGIIGRGGYSSYLNRCYFSGGATNPPPFGLLSRAQVSVDAVDCVVSGYTYFYAISGQGVLNSSATNHYYDRGKAPSSGSDNSVKETDITHLYDITHSPMDNWDFTATGPWSTTQDTVTFPPHKTRFLADISGTVTGYSSGKEIALNIPKMTAGMVNSGAGDASVTSFDLGTVFTLAFSADITVSKNSVIQSSVTNCLIGLDLGSITIASGGSAANLSFTGTGYGLHRWVITRSTNQYYVYRDGVQVASQNTAILGSLTQFDRVFRGDYPYNTYTTAKYGEIFISSDAKSASWVTDDWTLATRPGWNGKYYYTSEANITHLWHFDEGTGTTATDLVGGNTITIPTPTWSTSVLCAELKRRVDTTGSGDFAFTGVDSMYGTPVLFFINGETVKGALLTNLTEGTTAVTGVTMEQDTMVIGDTNLNPSVTYATANIVAPTATTDYCFRATSNILYYRDGCDVLIPTSCTYSNYAIRQDTSETGSITIAGTFGGTTPVLESPTSITISGTTGTGWVPMDNATCDVTVSGYSKIQSNGAGIRDLTIASGGEASCFGNILGDLDNQGTFHSQGIHFYGDINNEGTWDGAGNTWLMDDCTLTGTGITFYYLKLTAGKTYTFQDGETYTLADETPDFNGTVGSLVTLRSTTPGTRFTIDNASVGAMTFSYMDIQDSQVSGSDINAKRSIDSGNTDKLSATPHWVFWEYQKGFRINHN